MIRAFGGHTPRIADDAYVDDTALVIGNVEVGAESSIWPMAIIRGDIHSIRLGARTNVQDGSVLHVTHDSRYAPGGHGLVLGSNVTIGHRVVLHGCTIGDGCLIGMGAVLMDGSHVHPQTMVGAGSLVPPGTELDGGLWLGSPVRRVRDLRPQELEYLDYVAAHYVKLQQAHRGDRK